MRFFVFFLVLFAISLGGSAVAMELPGLVVTLACDSFGYGDFNITADRDNTGLGSEAYQISVVDGVGTLLHFTENTSGLPLGSYFEGGNPSVTYNQAATPLDAVRIYTWLSVAGNGFEDEVAYTTTNPDCGEAPPTEAPTNTPESGTPSSIVVTVILVWPSQTPTPTPTEGPSPTPTGTPTPTPDFMAEATVEVDGVGQDVALLYTINAGEIGIILFLFLIAGLLLWIIFFGDRINEAKKQ